MMIKCYFHSTLMIYCLVLIFICLKSLSKGTGHIKNFLFWNAFESCDYRTFTFIKLNQEMDADCVWKFHPSALDQNLLNKLNTTFWKKMLSNFTEDVFQKKLFFYWKNFLDTFQIFKRYKSETFRFKPQNTNSEGETKKISKAILVSYANILYALLLSHILTWWEIAIIILPTLKMRWLEYSYQQKTEGPDIKLSKYCCKWIIVILALYYCLRDISVYHGIISKPITFNHADCLSPSNSGSDYFQVCF